MPDREAPKQRSEIAHVLFIDIVGYSKLLTNEQKARIETLKNIVRGTEQYQRAKAEEKLLGLPTGDGGALVFRNDHEAPALCAMVHRTVRGRLRSIAPTSSALKNGFPWFSSAPTERDWLRAAKQTKTALTIAPGARTARDRSKRGRGKELTEFALQRTSKRSACPTRNRILRRTAVLNKGRQGVVI